MAFQAVFVQAGELIDYTPSADVAAGEVVVLGELVGVAKLPIANGVLGALTLEGVFEFAKATGVGTDITPGANVYWDDANNVATVTSAGNKLIGKCVKAAATTDAVVRVKLNQ